MSKRPKAIDPVGCLYILTFPSGKSYIGITTVGVEKRISMHRHRARHRTLPLCLAIKKYPVFQFRVLVKAKLSYLNELEVAAIEKFNTRVPSGYNLSFGGELSPMLVPEIRARALISSRKANSLRIGKPGTPHTEESKRRISETLSGRVFSPETIAKMSRSAKMRWRQK